MFKIFLKLMSDFFLIILSSLLLFFGFSDYLNDYLLYQNKTNVFPYFYDFEVIFATIIYVTTVTIVLIFLETLIYFLFKKKFNNFLFFITSMIILISNFLNNDLIKYYFSPYDSKFLNGYANNVILPYTLGILIFEIFTIFFIYVSLLVLKKQNII